MAIAFDAVGYPASEIYTATFSWTHTPVGTPRGVAVIVVQEGSTDQVSGVTYGGVAMGRVVTYVRTTTEAGRVYIYFLGTGVLTGARTVQVTLTGTLDTNACSLTVTSAAVNTQVDVYAGADAGIIANPSLTIVPTVAAVIFYGIFSGLAAPVATVQSGSTHIKGNDLGIASAMWARKSVGAGSTTIGYTAASDDVCHSALAIKEAGAQTFYQSTPATAIGVATLTKISTRYRTLAAVATGVPVLSKKMYQTLTATAIGVATIVTAKLFTKLLAAIAIGTATLTKVSTYVQSLSAVAIGVPTLTKIATHYVTLSAVAIGTVTLTKKMWKTLAAIAVGLSTVSTSATYYRTLSAIAVGVATLSRAALYLESIVATAVGVAVLNAVKILGSGGVPTGVKRMWWMLRRVLSR